MICRRLNSDVSNANKKPGRSRVFYFAESGIISFPGLQGQQERPGLQELLRPGRLPEQQELLRPEQQEQEQQRPEQLQRPGPELLLSCHKQ